MEYVESYVQPLYIVQLCRVLEFLCDYAIISSRRLGAGCKTRVRDISCVLSGMIGRIAITGAIFKKVLELNLTTIGQVSIGKIVNLAGYDVQRLDKVCRRICTYHQHVDHLLVCICVKQFYSTRGCISTVPHFFLQAFLFSIYFILTPVHVIAVTLVLWFYIGLGPSSLAGMGAVLMQIPMLYLFGKLYAKLR